MDTTAAGLPAKVRQQRIVTTRSVGIGWGWLIIVPLCLTIIGTFVAVPLMTILQRLKASSATKGLAAEGREAFAAFIGQKAEYLDVDACGYGSNLKEMSAAGMAYAGGRLFVLEEGVAAELPWELIRSWKWRTEGASQTHLYGDVDIASQMQIGAANQNAQALAYRASGFIITTADIDKPEWHYQTDDEKVLKKWLEILTQMKEGRLPRR